MIRAGKKPPAFEVGQLDTRVSLTGGAPNKRFATYVANLPEEEQEDVDTMLVLFALTQTKRVDAASLAPVLQRHTDATEMILRRLATDDVGMIAPSARTARSAHPKYYLRSEALRALGPALAYRAEGHDVIEEKIIQLVAALGTVENKTVQISCDVDVQTASGKLRELAHDGVLENWGPKREAPASSTARGRTIRPSSRAAPAAGLDTSWRSAAAYAYARSPTPASLTRARRGPPFSDEPVSVAVGARRIEFSG